MITNLCYTDLNLVINEAFAELRFPEVSEQRQPCGSHRDTAGTPEKYNAKTDR